MTSQGGSRRRCTDRFVRYPYPKCAVSYYQREFQDKIKNARLLTEEDVFNPEKETKIINPHSMEVTTTQKSSFKPFEVKPAVRDMRTIAVNDAPIAKHSSYQAEFPNW